MNKVCCPNCYKFTSFESTSPNFCGFCGKSFSTSTEAIANKPAPTPIPKTPKNRPQPIVKLEYTDDNNESIPDLGQLQFTIDPNIRPRKEKAESLAGTSKNQPIPISSAKNKKTKTLSVKELQSYWAEQFPKTKRDNSSTIGDKE